MNNSIKRFGIGLIGGMIPLAFFLFFSNSSAKNHVDSRIQNGGEQNGQAVNFNGSMEIAAENFIAASENSLNSVVHVTTTVETTSFQRDVFSEFFYGPGAGGQEFKQYGSGSGSGVVISEDGY
ncbi:MAG: hypothetical protein ACKVJC_11230, partial [Flavobacteriales bacterium]